MEKLALPRLSAALCYRPAITLSSCRKLNQIRAFLPAYSISLQAHHLPIVDQLNAEVLGLALHSRQGQGSILYLPLLQQTRRCSSQGIIYNSRVTHQFARPLGEAREDFTQDLLIQKPCCCEAIKMRGAGDAGSPELAAPSSGNKSKRATV